MSSKKLTTPRVSVILPAYNATLYIAESIVSILNQSMTEFELLIVDDNSTDDTLNKVHGFAARDRRVRVIALPHNMGVSAARNIALKEARAEYVAWQDADDISLPSRLALQADYLDAHRRVGMVGGYLEFFTTESGIRSTRKYAMDDATLRSRIFRYSPVALPVAMVRREAVLDVGGFDEKMHLAEDLDLAFRIGQKWKFANIPKVLLHYRQSSNSATSTKLRKMESATFRVRCQYSQSKAYKPKFVDYVYNFVQFLSMWIPARARLWLFGIIRNNKPAKIIFIGHSVYRPDGKIADAHYAFTFEFLEHYYPGNYKIVRHSLYDKGESRVYSQGLTGKYTNVPIIASLPGPMRYVCEILFNLAYLLYQRLFGKLVVISIDPLSTFAPAFLRYIGLGHSVDSIFLTPDFAIKRFDNKLLNGLYQLTDKFCTKWCTRNLCSSSLVVDHKIWQYKSVDSRKVVHSPNVPPPWLIDQLNLVPKVARSVVYVGEVSDHIDFPKIFASVANLGLTLTIVGSGSGLESLCRLVSSKGYKNISLLGQVSYVDALKEVAKAEVGIALYLGNLEYDKFRDSMKIREYQALSTIPLASRIVVSNATEIGKYNSGILVNNSSQEIEQALTSIFTDPVLHTQLVAGCKANHEAYTDHFSKLYEYTQILSN